MQRLRRLSRMAHALALLAIVVRTIVPALHSEECRSGSRVGAEIETTQVCSCGHVHASSSSDQDEARVVEHVPGSDESRSAHACIACEVELGKPFGGPADDDGRASRPAARISRGIQPSDRLVVADLAALPESRAPPATDCI